MQDPLACLLELHRACSAGQPAPPAVAQWFMDGVRRAVARGERLDQGLGLSGAGTRSLQTRLAQIERDWHLVAAARCCVLDDTTATTWTQATRLAPLLVEFAAEWPRLRRLPAPPADWPGWKTHVFRAAQCDLDLPASPHHVMALIDRAVTRRMPAFSPKSTCTDDACPCTASRSLARSASTPTPPTRSSGS